MMFDKYLNVDMLEYSKLFEDRTGDNGNEMSALSSIKEERESKEEHQTNKKITNYFPGSREIDSEGYREGKEGSQRHRVFSGDIQGSEERQSVSEDSAREIKGEYEKQDSPFKETGKTRTDPMRSSSDDLARDSEGELRENDELSEQEILDIAEKVFIKISSKMKAKQLSLRQLYEDKITESVVDGQRVEILEPTDLIDAFKILEFDELEEVEIECLLRVLLKPEINDSILFSDLVMILDNFGIEEGS